MRVLVAGGGSSGLIAAITLKKYLNIKVDLVKSDKIGTVGVGEGSTEHFKEFLQLSGIDHTSIIKECGAVYKAGVFFKNFSSKSYMHSTAYPFDIKAGQYRYLYAHQIGFNDSYLQPNWIKNNCIPKWYMDTPLEAPTNQFHFDTFKLNDFLINFAKSIGITIYDDEILNVNLDEYGSISSLTGKKTTYTYDFYIDSTGFSKLLISKLGGKWKSFKKYMKMDSAVVFPTEEEDEYNLWSLAQGLNSGWLFKVPVQGRHGNGYVFDSSHITLDEAQKEIEDLFGKKIDFAKSFTFDPGFIDKAWIKNCVAIGLSSLFVEPLEASAIGISIQQSFLLMHRLSNYDNKSIDSYNKSFEDLAINVRDFIVLHYVSDRRDTPFWKDVATVDLPDSLQYKLDMWKTRLPIAEDFNNVVNYGMFQDSNFILVMEGQGLFNREMIKKEFLLKSDLIVKTAKDTIANLKLLDANLKTVGHKEFINYVKGL